MIRLIEHGTTSDGRHFLRLDGQVIAMDDKAGPVEDARAKLRAQLDKGGHEYQERRCLLRVTSSPGGDLPKCEPVKLAPAELVDRKIGDLRADLATGLYDDDLDAIREAELAGKARAGALDAIGDRQVLIASALEADGEDDGASA